MFALASPPFVRANSMLALSFIRSPSHTRDLDCPSGHPFHITMISPPPERNDEQGGDKDSLATRDARLCRTRHGTRMGGISAESARSLHIVDDSVTTSNFPIPLRRKTISQLLNSQSRITTSKDAIYHENEADGLP